MGEVVVVVTIEVKEGEEDRVRDAFSRVAAATHEEPGCQTYALHGVRDDPQRFVLIERWRSQDDLDAHFDQPYIKLMADSMDALIGAPQVTFCESVPTGDPGKGVL